MSHFLSFAGHWHRPRISLTSSTPLFRDQFCYGQDFRLYLTWAAIANYSSLLTQGICFKIRLMFKFNIRNDGVLQERKSHQELVGGTRSAQKSLGIRCTSGYLVTWVCSFGAIPSQPGPVSCLLLLREWNSWGGSMLQSSQYCQTTKLWWRSGGFCCSNRCGGLLWSCLEPLTAYQLLTLMSVNILTSFVVL